MVSQAADNISDTFWHLLCRERSGVESDPVIERFSVKILRVFAQDIQYIRNVLKQRVHKVSNQTPRGAAA